MKWIQNDIKQYISAKEYIDTAVIPLVPYAVDNDEDMLQTSFQQELMALYTHQLEQRLKGRLFLLPVYTYLKNGTLEKELERLNGMTAEILKQPFKQVFLFTFDKQWRKHQSTLDGELIWLPSIQNGDLQSNEVREVIQSQIIDIEDLIKESWS